MVKMARSTVTSDNPTSMALARRSSITSPLKVNLTLKRGPTYGHADHKWIGAGDVHDHHRPRLFLPRTSLSSGPRRGTDRGHPSPLHGCPHRSVAVATAWRDAGPARHGASRAQDRTRRQGPCAG